MPNLLSTLPQVKGRLTPDAPLAHMTWFQVGGPAEVLFKPQDLEDLQNFLRAKSPDISVFPLGVASNLIIRDAGIPGVVLRLGRGFTDISHDDDLITAGAGALDGNVALYAAQVGLGGLEFLSGIPGTIGGAVRMNAGAYGTETKDVLVWAEVLSPDGDFKRLEATELGFSYRKSSLPEGFIVVRACFRGTPTDPQAIHDRIQEIKNARAETQPVREKTGGSTFKNPEGHRAWQLIDEAGCRGLTWGGAKMSELHCNFMINFQNATALDLENLGEEVRSRVFKKSGILLEWEIKRVGRKIMVSTHQEING